MKKIIAQILKGFLLLFIYNNIYSQTTATDSLLFAINNNYNLKVVAPANWKIDTVKAKQFDVDIIIYRTLEELNSGGVLIYISFFEKKDENTSADLNASLQKYVQKFPKVKFYDIEIAHPKYICYDKLAYIPDKVAEYLTLLNPGAEYKYSISVVMNLAGRKATLQEYEAYQKTISSLEILKNN